MYLGGDSILLLWLGMIQDQALAHSKLRCRNPLRRRIPRGANSANKPCYGRTVLVLMRCNLRHGGGETIETIGA